MEVDKKAVLVVEDEPELQRLIVKTLAEVGHRPIVAADYQSALAQLEKVIPGVVLVDLNLPRDSGYDLCTHIRDTMGLSWVGIIVMSDRHSPEDMAYAEEAGANGFLKKPFSVALLKRYMSAVLDLRLPSRPSIRRLKPSEPPPPSIRRPLRSDAASSVRNVSEFRRGGSPTS